MHNRPSFVIFALRKIYFFQLDYSNYSSYNFYIEFIIDHFYAKSNKIYHRNDLDNKKRGIKINQILNMYKCYRWLCGLLQRWLGFRGYIVYFSKRRHKSLGTYSFRSHTKWRVPIHTKCDVIADSTTTH